MANYYKPISRLHLFKLTTDITSKFKLSNTNCAAVSYEDSIKVCHALGIKKKELLDVKHETIKLNKIITIMFVRHYS